MPEYLSPGVYVEEVDTGSKPIEGVSTSTAGMVGVTERGPVNVPILITSFAEFTRWFGGYLNVEDFPEPDNQSPFRYLPHAVEGFFTNGGKRVFVVRVLENAAQFATSFLFDRGTPATAATQLLHSIAGGSTDIYLVDSAGVAVTTPSMWLQIGDGSEAEYRQVKLLGTANEVLLNLPLARAHIGVGVDHYAAAALTVAPAPGGDSRDLSVDAAAGDTQITVNSVANLNPAGDDLLRIGTAGNGDDEYIFTDSTNAAANTIRLRTPLMLSHTGGAPGPGAGIVQMMTPLGAPADSTQISAGSAASVGDTAVFLQNRTGFTTPSDVVRIAGATPADVEIRRIGQLATITLSSGAYDDYPAGSIVERVNPTPDLSPTRNMDPAQAGTNVISLENRDTLQKGDIISIGTGNEVEYLAIRDIQNRSLPPDPGNVILAAPLQRSHVATPAATKIPVQRQVAPIARTAPPALTAIALATSRNSTMLVVSAGNGYAQGNFIRLTTASGTYYHRVESNASILTPVPVTLSNALELPHSTGTEVVARSPLLLVQALDAGAWGDRLRVTVEDQDPPLLRTQIRNTANGIIGIVDATHMRLNSASGVEVGTVLQRLDANGIPQGNPFQVIDIDRQQNSLLTFAPPGALGAVEGDQVRSLEFKLNVLLLRSPDPAVPLRSETVLDSESYRYLSMDSRHSRYVEKIIGTTWVQGASVDDALPAQPLRLEDRRSKGESSYLRISDLAKSIADPVHRDATLNSIRLGPELLVDVLPDGRTRPARRALNQGDDAVGTITDDTYVGLDNTEPLLRTGLQSLRNQEEISIVACPGRTSFRIQDALINHCELMRYRFAVLDASRPPDDSLNDVQVQRQQFDTKYAALYHPWPLIPDPFPTNLAEVADYPIPPSGHVVGVYARTDVERGVHKAPANEVLSGVIGLQRLLNKAEQDILNPYPVNVNVIRDFRPNNRGLRVWGGRVITSDPDWKYVNVRRLLIFIEASIDRGLQWVVFEPNAEPLWARVNRTVSNFLTSVWRDGALEGTKPEEAYFVKCDRTTMTQTDIDNGKLIVVIGVAPVKPAEFVIIRIGLWTAYADS